MTSLKIFISKIKVYQRIRIRYNFWKVFRFLPSRFTWWWCHAIGQWFDFIPLGRKFRIPGRGQIWPKSLCCIFTAFKSQERTPTKTQSREKRQRAKGVYAVFPWLDQLELRYFFGHIFPFLSMSLIAVLQSKIFRKFLTGKTTTLWAILTAWLYWRLFCTYHSSLLLQKFLHRTKKVNCNS